MGRATITGGGTDGLYSIEADVGQARIDARIDDNSDRQSDLISQIAIGEVEVADLIAAQVPIREYIEQTLTPAYNAAVAANSGVEAAKAALSEQLRYLYLTVAFTRDAQRRLDALKFQLAALKKERAVLLAVDTTKTANAWCADLTEDATGEVATIEIPGEPTYLLIAPEGRAPAVADGQLLARGAQTGPQAYFNAAILPGWQKWMPDYRAGIISDIDFGEDTATVTLFDVRSTAQSLPVNQAAVLTGVPVSYMTCNAAAFEDGDEVVVQFLDRDWQLPTVIGFLHDPKPCAPKLAWYFNAATIDLVVDYAADIQPEPEAGEPTPLWLANEDPPGINSPQPYTTGDGFMSPARSLLANSVYSVYGGVKTKRIKIRMQFNKIAGNHGFEVYGTDGRFWSGAPEGTPNVFDGFAVLIFSGEDDSQFQINQYPANEHANVVYFRFPFDDFESADCEMLITIGPTSQRLSFNGVTAATHAVNISAVPIFLGYIDVVGRGGGNADTNKIDYIEVY